MEKWRKDREDRRRQEQLYEKEYLSVAHTVAPGKDLKHILLIILFKFISVLSLTYLVGVFFLV